MIGKKRVMGPYKGPNAFAQAYKRLSSGRRKPAYRRRRRFSRITPPSRQLVGSVVEQNTVYINAQCVVREFELGNVGLSGDNYVTVNRYDYGGIYPGVASSIGVDNSPRFNDLKTLYREFIITGVKIEITPNDRDTVAENGVVQQNLLQNFNVYDDINIVSGWTVPALASRYVSDSYKQLSPCTPHLIYRSNRALARQQKTPWFDANPTSFAVTTGGPRAVTVVGWKVNDQNSVANYGSIRVTYYVTFRGQRV